MGTEGNSHVGGGLHDLCLSLSRPKWGNHNRISILQAVTVFTFVKGMFHIV